MRQRVLTAALAIPVVAAAVFAPSPWVLVCLLAACLLVCSRELGGLLGLGVGASLALGVVSGAVSMAALQLPQGPQVVLPLLWLVGMLYCAWPGAMRALGFLWVGAPLAVLASLRLEWPLDRFWPVITALLLAQWAGDIAAMLVGRRFGSRKLAPQLSPGKTVEGAIANVAASMGVALAAAQVLGWGWPLGVVLGVATGVMGQMGDLFESALKRRAGVKDSGSLLPGHGGLLDRIDSLLFSAIAFGIPAYLLLHAQPAGQ